jgi:secondary thiamine-phosphate synthase enzyme
MKQAQTKLQIQTAGPGLYDVSAKIRAWVGEQNINLGQLTVFIRHTSASLTIQENADAAVQEDIAEFFRRLVPENLAWYRHRSEGSDDMPAHLKSVLSDTSLTIPVGDGQPLLGTWQGIYLFEHRRRPHSRQLVLHLLGE